MTDDEEELHQRLIYTASAAAAMRREMAADVLSLLMTGDSEKV